MVRSRKSPSIFCDVPWLFYYCYYYYPPPGDRTRTVSACTYPLLSIIFSLSVQALGRRATVSPYLRVWLILQTCTMYVGLLPRHLVYRLVFFFFSFTIYFCCARSELGMGRSVYLSKAYYGGVDMVTSVLRLLFLWRCGLRGDRRPDFRKGSYRIANRTVSDHFFLYSYL